jgi:hypothetical protein
VIVADQPHGCQALTVSELPRATRSFVVLGLFMMAALALAVREYMRSSDNRGEPDEWMWVLIVGTGEQPRLDYRQSVGFQEQHEDLEQVVASGRELLDDPDASPISAAIAHADEHGHGFLLIDLRDGWDLSAFGVEATPGSNYAAIGIGDVARNGTRISFGAPVTGPIKYIEDSIDVIAMQLALFEHPDLHALFEERIPGPIAKRSRWALGEGNGEYERKREVLLHQQRRLVKIDEEWPSERIPGNLAGHWEHVRAVPVNAGVMIEVLPIRLDVPMHFLEAEMSSKRIGELAFVPIEALAAGRDPIAARRPCAGLRERTFVENPPIRKYVPVDRDGLPRDINLDVSPDGRTLALRRSNGEASVDIYRFVDDSPDTCELEWMATAVPPTRELPKPSNSGSLSWGYTYDQVWWWHAGTQHQIPHPRVLPNSGTWWSGDDLLAARGEIHVPTPEDGNRSRATQAAIMLLRTDIVDFDDSHLAPRARLDASALFPKLDRRDPAKAVIDYRPVGSESLLVLTGACPASHMLGDERLQRPCMHRVSFRSPLRERIGSEPMLKPLELTHRDLEVRTLGPIDSYWAIAIGADGTRAAYVAYDAPVPGLFAVTIDEAGLGPVERVADADGDSELRLSADGRILVVEGPFAIGEYGERTTARAFVLAPQHL